MIVDIEDDVMDPVMQCTTLPSHSGFSQKKLVSFVTEIHTLSIDISPVQDCNIEYRMADCSPAFRLPNPKCPIESYALSWKPCQGDSLNLPDHRYNIYTIKWETRGFRDDGDVCLRLIPAKSDS
ncbi:hypothetical protein Tco_0507903 [Tanacetum coccineum]